MSCQVCPVRDRALCSSLADDELCELKYIARERLVCREQTICWAGEEGLICANVVTGLFKVTAALGDGHDQTVGILYPGDFIGSPTPSTNKFSITALTDSSICVFPRHLLEKFLSAHSHMERVLLQRTQASLDEARERIMLLAHRSAEVRVATFLVDMARRSPVKTRVPDRTENLPSIELSLSRAQMGEILGLSNETVSRVLSRLSRRGLVDFPNGRRVAILNRSALSEIAIP